MSNTTLLLLRLEAPLQSWGIRARWDIRDSADEPTKSGIVGLLGCALGYGIGDERLETHLGRSLILGVRTEQPGRPMVDFHTVYRTLTALGKPKTIPNSGGVPHTIISRRSYLQDAAFLAVLSGPEALLRECRDALANPQWPLFLGRKCCVPTRPVLDALTDEYVSIDDALRRHRWSCQSAERAGHGPPHRLRCTVDDLAGPSRRWDVTRTNPARMYGCRNVRTFVVPTPGQEGS